MTRRIGHYEIVAELERGGMGVVYRGYEPALGRHVAIKALAPTLAHQPALVERFLREARAMAALNDPHIVQIHFIGETAGQPFFAMEFVEGESLSQLIRRVGRVPVVDALKILLQAARGLQAAHERGLVHRDIKPANLLLDQRGRLKIADFGIALARSEFDTKLTGTGEFVGTPGYLSPEVCLGQPVDARSDLFGLVVVLFEALTGRPPFSDESPFKLMLDVVQGEIPDVRALNPEVDADTMAVLARLVAKQPADRYASAAELVAALERHPLLVGQGTQLGLQVLAAAPAASQSGDASLATVVSAVATPDEASAPTSTNALRRPLLMIAGLLALGVLGGMAFGAWRSAQLASAASMAEIATPAQASADEPVREPKAAEPRTAERRSASERRAAERPASAPRVAPAPPAVGPVDGEGVLPLVRRIEERAGSAERVLRGDRGELERILRDEVLVPPDERDEPEGDRPPP